MLRKRSRGVSSSKQGLMTDPSTLPSPTGSKYTRPITSSLFTTPRLFVGFSPDFSSEAAMSPTSILETKPFTPFGNPFFSDRKSITPPPCPPTATTVIESKHQPWDNGDSKPIGLGLVDALNNDDNATNSFKPESRMVLFGSQLKIQVPTIQSNSISPTSSIECPHSPIEFGIKNRDSQLALYSPARRSPNLGSEAFTSSSPRVFTGCLSPGEMELSEDYTCVITHGPNPRTTHIFDNCIIESCADGFFASRKESGFSSDSLGYPSDGFLSYCYACKKNLGQGKDIFMYRGEKAFCSEECRYQEMLFHEEGLEKCSPDL